ncbi:MAG: class I SAM-dependent methyltransferase [Candidatus Dactylopiibacterium sp.]|nr:class I SAM-dependent methyltransferase [Candidatus Dactylopiibacterium sp.]
MNEQNKKDDVCCICGQSMRQVFRARVLCHEDVPYLHCERCGFLRTETPFWLEEAYAEAIAATDVGLVERNRILSSQLASVLYFALGARAHDRVLDVAGGYGLLVRMLRDYGFDCFWQDRYCRNLFASGFEVPDAACDAEVVTAIEVMEHLVDPMAFVREVLERTRARHFLFTTELYEGPPPAPDAWWYYSRETGQHVSFFSRQTLETMARALGVTFMSYRGLHMLTRQPVSPAKFRLAAGRLHAVASAWTRRRLPSRIGADYADALVKLRAGLQGGEKRG